MTAAASYDVLQEGVLRGYQAPTTAWHPLTAFDKSQDLGLWLEVPPFPEGSETRSNTTPIFLQYPHRDDRQEVEEKQRNEKRGKESGIGRDFQELEISTEPKGIVYRKLRQKSCTA